MPTVTLRSPILPPTLVGSVPVRRSGVPRFWASLWLDIIKGSLEPSTKKRHALALDRLYQAAERQRGSDCLDRLLANIEIDAIESVLVGFLAELRNEATIDGIDRSSMWATALSFVTDILHHGGTSAGAQAHRIEARLLRLDTMYSQLAPNPVRAAPPIRALPPVVIEDLYAIFDPSSHRNPFKTDALRWRNLLIFMLLLRLGLRRGEAALLVANSIKDDVDPGTGQTVVWLDVEETQDDDPRYEEPGLKTGPSRRQLPVPKELVLLTDKYLQNYRGRTHYPYLFMSQKGRPLSVRAMNEVFEAATRALSAPARKSLAKQGLSSVSCHDLRHTCAVVRMRRYQDSGDDLDRATERLRRFFGWSPQSQMPRLYAKAYFETKLSEVWEEQFDDFTGALRRTLSQDEP